RLVQYIIEIAKKVAEVAGQKSASVFSYIRTLPEELDRLDPRDFLPGARYDFVMARADARRWAQQSGISDASFQHIVSMANRVAELLTMYGGPSSGNLVRSFAFVKD